MGRLYQFNLRSGVNLYPNSRSKQGTFPREQPFFMMRGSFTEYSLMILPNSSRCWEAGNHREWFSIIFLSIVFLQDYSSPHHYFPSIFDCLQSFMPSIHTKSSGKVMVISRYTGFRQNALRALNLPTPPFLITCPSNFIVANFFMILSPRLFSVALSASVFKTAYLLHLIGSASVW